MLHETLRGIINAVAGVAGARLVHKRWGPRGPFESLLKARAGGIAIKHIIDVGASDGIWSAEALGHFQDAGIFMVDAREKNRAALEAFKKTHAQCDYWIGALGGAPGTQAFFESGDQSSLYSSTAFPNMQRREIEVRTLDSFLEAGTIPAPDLIKADVQGYELEVLKGALKCMQQSELLLLEVSYQQLYEHAPLAHEVIAWLGEKGFRIYDICTYSHRPRDWELAQSDILFAKMNSKLFEHEGWA